MVGTFLPSTSFQPLCQGLSTFLAVFEKAIRFPSWTGCWLQNPMPFVDLRTAFPLLTTLDLSGCPLNMNVWDLLQPLRYNHKLVWMVARDAGLEGEVKDMQQEENFPLLFGFKVLDLADNQILGLSLRHLKAWFGPFDFFKSDENLCFSWFWVFLVESKVIFLIFKLLPKRLSAASGDPFF